MYISVTACAYMDLYVYEYMNMQVHVVSYTGCNRRNVKNFGRVFLMLKYTENTQNTYIQSLTVSEIMASEFETLTADTHLLINKFILKVAGICG
jgi:hypothetical protein